MDLLDLSVLHKSYILYMDVDITVKVILHYTQSLTVSGMSRLAEAFGKSLISLTSLV